MKDSFGYLYTMEAVWLIGNTMEDEELGWRMFMMASGR